MTTKALGWGTKERSKVCWEMCRSSPRGVTHQLLNLGLMTITPLELSFLVYEIKVVEPNYTWKDLGVCNTQERCSKCTMVPSFHGRMIAGLHQAPHCFKDLANILYPRGDRSQFCSLRFKNMGSDLI